MATCGIHIYISHIGLCHVSRSSSKKSLYWRLSFRKTATKAYPCFLIQLFIILTYKSFGRAFFGLPEYSEVFNHLSSSATITGSAGPVGAPLAFTMEGPITAGAIAETIPHSPVVPEKWTIMPADLSTLVELEARRMIQRRSEFVAEVEGAYSRGLPMRGRPPPAGGPGTGGKVQPARQGCGGRYYILKHGQRYYLLQLPCCRVARYVPNEFHSSNSSKPAYWL